MTRWIAYLLFCLIFALFLLEVLIRVSGRADHLYTEPAFELSSGGDYWRYRPGFEGRVLGLTRVRIGPLGSRLHGSTYDGPEGAVTVAIFGDSITFGQGVADHLTFAAQLEERLLEANTPAQVLNFGVQGHSLEMELAHLADRRGEINPRVVVLAFPSADLNPKRVENHVDRFGYLTKTAFGPPTFWMDVFRAISRQSHLALLTKVAMLRLQALRSLSKGSTSATEADLEPLLVRFRRAITRFEELTPGVQRIVMCLDLHEIPLTRHIRDIMRAEFPHLTYVHAAPAFAQSPLHTLLVPRDGHPNATAHGIYAELLWPPLAAAVQSLAR
jgi:hypothetical protein